MTNCWFTLLVLYSASSNIKHLNICITLEKGRMTWTFKPGRASPDFQVFCWTGGSWAIWTLSKKKQKTEILNNKTTKCYKILKNLKKSIKIPKNVSSFFRIKGGPLSITNKRHRTLDTGQKFKKKLYTVKQGQGYQCQTLVFI